MSKRIKKHKMFGYYELGTVVPSSGKTKGCLETFDECQTHFYVSIKIENRSASEMCQVISEFYERSLKNTFKMYMTD